MRIKLTLPTEARASLSRLGLTQPDTETLRLRREGDGLEVIVRGKSGVELSPRDFAALFYGFDARIEVDSVHTKERVERVLQCSQTGTAEAVIVVTDPHHNTSL